MAKKKFDPKAKAKRQKVIAGVGGVLLLVMLAIQVPRTMKLMNSQSQSADTSTPSSSTTASGTQPLAPPSLAGSSAGSTSSGEPAATATSSDGISDPTAPLSADAGQLVSFSHFKSKDPFKQQLSIGTSSSSSTPTTPSATAGAGLTAGPNETKVPVSKVKPTTATISVNGTNNSVTVGAAFPAGAPVFTLVSLTSTAAKIGIATGSYESGASSVSLSKGKTVTLQNTADGARYTLRLVSTA
jgi:hypothetical protein